MKSKLLFLILFLFTFSLFAVNQVGICSVCHKPLTQCEGHIPVPTKCYQCGQTNCRIKNNHKKCPACELYDFKCEYKLNHPTCSDCERVVGAKHNQCEYGGKHPNCKQCELPIRSITRSSCQFDGSHKKCFDCERVVGAKRNPCEYGGKHPTCKQCELPIRSTTRCSCQFDGNHELCGVCHKPIGGTPSNSCEFGGQHPQLYEVSFDCNPKGTIYIDGNFLGPLPLKQKLDAGEHELTIRADGYKEYKETIVVGQASEKKFSFSLEPILPPAEGSVMDTHGRPLKYASILVKGTTKGVMADENGHYSIKNVKKGQTLRAASVGYKPFEQVWNGTPLNFVLKSASRKGVHVGVIPTFQVGRTMALGVSLDYLIGHFCMEAGYLYGLSTQDIYWISEKYDTSRPETIRPVCIAPLRLGYGIAADSHLRLTPQIGVNLMQVAGDVSGCYAMSAAAGLRADFTLAKHFGVTLTPEYVLPIQKSYTYQRLMDCGAKNFASGFNVRIGFNIFL